MKEIIIYGHSGSGNHGCEAIVKTTRKILNQDCTIYSNDIIQDKKYGIENNLEKYSNVIKQKSIRRYFYAVYCRIFKNSMIRYKYLYKPFLEKIEQGKTYLSVGGDHYCYSTYSNHVYDFLNAEIKNKGGKSVLWSCSIEGKYIDDKTLKSLKNYDLITVRESISYDNLMEKGISKNVILVPDVAFKLQTKENDISRKMEDDEFIGINVSPMVQKYGSSQNMVLKNYECLIEYILNKTSKKIALIPHVVWSDNDDRVPLKYLYEKYKDTNRLVMISDMKAEELKAVIAKCCFFVGARTHSTIAAYSSCIPTLVVGYSVKARGIARDLFGKEENYVISVQDMKNEDDLKNAFSYLWNDRNEIKKHLEKIMPEYCAKLDSVKEIVEKL